MATRGAIRIVLSSDGCVAATLLWPGGIALGPTPPGCVPVRETENIVLDRRRSVMYAHGPGKHRLFRLHDDGFYLSSLMGGVAGPFRYPGNHSLPHTGTKTLEMARPPHNSGSFGFSPIGRGVPAGPFVLRERPDHSPISASYFGGPHGSREVREGGQGLPGVGREM